MLLYIATIVLPIIILTLVLNYEKRHSNAVVKPWY